MCSPPQYCGRRSVWYALADAVADVLADVIGLREDSTETLQAITLTLQQQPAMLEAAVALLNVAYKERDQLTEQQFEAFIAAIAEAGAPCSALCTVYVYRRESPLLQYCRGGVGGLSDGRIYH